MHRLSFALDPLRYVYFIRVAGTRHPNEGKPIPKAVLLLASIQLVRGIAARFRCAVCHMVSLCIY